MLFSCKNESHDVDYFDMPYIGTKEISLHQISLEKLALDSFNTTYIGDFYVKNNFIYYIDKRFCTVNKFDLDGSFIKKMVGLGKGPNETMVGRVSGYSIAEDFNILVGPSQDYHLFDADWRSISHQFIEGQPRSHISVNSTPPTDDPGLYALDYHKMSVHSFGEKFFVNITTDHPYCNYFLPIFHKQCPIILQIDIMTGAWEDMYGRWSPEYLKYNGLGQFSFLTFDIDSQGRFYVCFEIDPRIYVYDREFKPLYSFGERGTHMDTNYTEFNLNGNIHNPVNLKKINEIYQSDHANKGYFKTMKLFDKRNLLFRTYSKNEKKEKDGLQIYNGEKLIADVDVPKSFKVVGYSNPWFYAETDGINESELFSLYRFKIPEYYD